jgi:hypothetical protein
MFEDLAHITGVEEEVLILLLESSVETAHKIYIDNMKRLNRTNEKLQYAMRINERKSYDARHKLPKKEEVLKSKERIVVSLENKLHQIKKEKDGVTNKLADTKKKIKNGNKKSQSQKKKEKLAIAEIPILIDDQELEDKEKSRDIFFYDIPKYRSKEDIVKELSKIGKVYQIQVKKQYKYLSVKASILLHEQFKKSFVGGAFGMGINKHFVRWYPGESLMKERKERDQ